VHTWQCSVDSQTADQDGHQGLIRHWIHDATDDGLEFPSSCDPSVKKVRDACIGKEAEGPNVLVMENKVADYWRRNEAGCSQKVRDRVDILMALHGF
jgi:hypothetical protein